MKLDSKSNQGIKLKKLYTPCLFSAFALYIVGFVVAVSYYRESTTAIVIVVVMAVGAIPLLVGLGYLEQRLFGVDRKLPPLRFLCVKCGCPKQSPHGKCSRCAFCPVSQDDQAKSWLLSERHHSESELADISIRLKGGEEYVFNETELVKERETFEQPGPSGLKIVANILIFFASVCFFWWLLLSGIHGSAWL